MALPSRKVELPVEAVYAILAHLKRHREKTGPRSLRFQLAPGKDPVLVLEPWGIAIPCHGKRVEDDAPRAMSAAGGPYRAPPRLDALPTIPVIDGPQEIKVWGRRRLFALARVLPICDRVEVRLLGTGMPSIWVAHMGEMRLTLALSGWTANDWTSGANLGMLAGAAQTDGRTMSVVQEKLFGAQHASPRELAEAAGVPEDVTVATLHELAKHGQAIVDFAAGCYRYREVMPFALSEAVLGPEHPELAEGRKLAREKRVKLKREEGLAGGKRLYVFEAGSGISEAVIDADGMLKSAKCSCSFAFKNSGLRAGPCRHVVALRLTLAAAAAPPPAPAPTAGPRGPVKREEVVSLAKDLHAEIAARADEEDKGISDVLQDAWDLAFERMQSAATWRDALKLVDPRRADAVAGRSVSNPVQQTVLLHEEVLREIGLLAARFGASPSAVVNLAWLVARRPAGRA
jgi:hypothetical protein